jgi:hypothetical protein
MGVGRLNEGRHIAQRQAYFMRAGILHRSRHTAWEQEHCMGQADPKGAGTLHESRHSAWGQADFMGAGTLHGGRHTALGTHGAGTLHMGSHTARE